VVQEEALGAALVKVGRGLLEERIDGELELKLLQLQRRK
jgi:hypothetical protein